MYGWALGIVVIHICFYHLQQANQIQAIEIVEPTLWREVCVSTAMDRPQTALLNAVIPLIKQATKAEWVSEC